MGYKANGFGEADVREFPAPDFEAGNGAGPAVVVGRSHLALSRRRHTEAAHESPNSRRAAAKIKVASPPEISKLTSNS